MIDDLKNLQSKNIDLLDSGKLFPLMRWSTGDVNNYSVCKEINRLFFFVNKDILTGYFSLKLNSRTITKYPKPTKYDDKKLDLVLNILQKKYNYGKNDLSIIKPIIINIINNKNKDKLVEFANNYGLDNKERKLLGVEQVKFDKSKKSKTPQKSLF